MSTSASNCGLPAVSVTVPEMVTVAGVSAAAVVASPGEADVAVVVAGERARLRRDERGANHAVDSRPQAVCFRRRRT